MIAMQRSFSSPVRIHSPPPPAVTHALSGSPTPAAEFLEKHVDLPHLLRSPPRRASRHSESDANMEDTTPVPPRRSDGITRQPPPAVPLPLTNLMTSARTAAAVATTATVTATATATTTTAASAAAAAPPAIAAAPMATADTAASSLFPSTAAHLPHPPPSPFPRPPSPGPPTPAPYSKQNMTDRPPTSPADMSALSYVFPPRPLLQDASLYANPNRSPESEGTSLEELAHLVRLAKYQERKRANTRLRLQLSLVSNALSARLVRCGEKAHRSLSESFRSDDEKEFAELYDAIHNVRRSCDQMRKYALLAPGMDSLRSPASTESLDSTGELHTNLKRSGSVPITTFLDDIQPETRDVFLGFLAAIRNNPDYLASRLCSLSTSELSALTSFSKDMGPIDSVLPFYSRQSFNRGSAASREASHSGAAAGGARDVTSVQKLLSFQRHDPMAALIHTCFANSAGPDSAEDKRRTDIWATACARLITEKGSAGEPVVVAAISAWTAMRDWSGRSNMEWFLMKILEDGAFLLDRAEDPNGTRFNLKDWTAKDQLAGEQFYDQAIRDLFDVIDDEDLTGIPEGVIELGNQILSKLDPKLVESTRNWLVYRWLFGVWLLGIVVHPETYGLMANYNITKYGRQKILKEVAIRAQKVVERTMALGIAQHSKPVSTPSSVKAHMGNILNRFRGPKMRHPSARLLPARSITSLRETVEVHPYLVLSPADLVTLVNALFPDHRPRSAQSSSIHSRPGSVFSGVSQPAGINIQQGNLDAYSVISTSASSTTSEATTSVEPLLEAQQTGTSLSRYSPSPSSMFGQDRRRLNNYEEDGYRLHLATRDMANALGRDAVSGGCHPCADHWAVLFISADGNGLSTQMTFDPEDDAEEDTHSSSVETDDDSEDQLSDLNAADLDRDYHQLRNAILKLVEDYEIPQGLETDGSNGQTFSNRASRQKKYRMKNQIITAEHASRARPRSHSHSRNPFWRRMQDDSEERGRRGYEQEDSRGKRADPSEPVGGEKSESVLISMLSAASSQSRAQSDFLSAHLYWRTVEQLNLLTSESLRRNGFAALLHIFSRGPRDSIRRSAAAVEEYDAWLIWLKQSQERAECVIDTMMRRLRALRDKMWYVTVVCNSEAYESARRIALGLKTIGSSRKWEAYQRSRQSLPRAHAASFMYRADFETIDLLTAGEEHGGPNKLSDGQADITRQWLQNSGIENFCQGEERIHRFCCEIRACISKLIAGNMTDAPVLWSSELYARERRHLEATNKRARDVDGGSATWDDASSMMSYADSDFGRFHSSVRSPSSSMRRGLRGTAGQGNFSRASTSLSDILGSEDFLSRVIPTPVSTIDSSTTYWSPFLAPVPTPATSQAQSPSASTTSLSGSFSPLTPNPRYPQIPRQIGGGFPGHTGSSTGRPSTSASSADTVFQRQIADEQSQFLDELRQTLASLLLSDLGSFLFARGSETDSWFGSLGQECIDRRSIMERKQRQEAALDKRRKAHHHLSQKVAVDHASANAKISPGSSISPASTGSGVGDVSPSADMHSLSSEAHSSGHDNDKSEAASDGTTTPGYSGSPRRMPGKSGTEFPFTKAYQHLLRMFCVHPDPYAKLNALSELESLIIASLSSRSTRRRLALLSRSRTEAGTGHATGGASANAGNSSRTQPLEDTIHNVKGRRASILVPPATLSSPSSAHRNGFGSAADLRPVFSASNAANKDAILSVLLSLFRDSAIRPKTLFRDLQLIASFVPAHVLDGTDRGKTFWNVGLAALLLKKEVCSTMVEVADEVVAQYTQSRKTAGAPASATSGPANSAPDGAASRSSRTPPLPTYSMADAGRMWTITAKEGNPTSQRELAIFYLANPELVERSVLPLSRPLEVFKRASGDKYGSSSGSGRYHSHQSVGVSTRGSSSSSGGGSLANSGAGGSSSAKGGVSDIRNDPALMCVAFHWMEAAERGGDEPAQLFLRQSNEMMQAP